MVGENDLAMEGLLDLMLRAVEGKADDDTHAPVYAAELMAERMIDEGRPVGALAWAAIAEGYRNEGVTVREFRSRTRETLARLARDGTP